MSTPSPSAGALLSSASPTDGSARVHVVVAWEHDGDVAALREEIAARDLDWRVTWLPLGDDATASASDLAPDVLICSGDSGWGRCQLLLEQVRRQQPHAVRLVLMEAGHNDRAVQALEHAHRVLPLPFAAMDVVEAIQSVHDLQALLQDPKLKLAIERVGALPSAPRQYIALTQLMRDPDVDTSSIAEVVGQDPALAARVLRLSNSAYYATGREIGDLRTAVVRLGLEALRRLVLAGEVFAANGDVEIMRERALRVSWLSAQILPGTSADLAATAGLLAEVGGLLPHDGPLAEVPHNVSGAYLLGLWGLPEAIVEAVAYHVEPELAAGPFWLAGALHVATSLVHGTPVDEDYLRRVGRLQDLPRWRTIAGAIPH